MDRIRKLNHACHTSGKLLLSLVNDILDLGRIENEAFLINKDFFNVSNLLAEVWDLFEE